MTNEQKLIRAELAKQLVESSLFIEAFDDTRNKLIEEIESCPMKDDEYRTKLVLSLQLLKNIKGAITTHIETGKLLTHALKQKTVFNRRGM